MHVCPNLLTNSYLIRLDVLLGNDTGVYDIFRHYLAPGGGCEVLFSPCLSVCLFVCVCLCVRPIFWYFISRLLEEILMYVEYENQNKIKLFYCYV